MKDQQQAFFGSVVNTDSIFGLRNNEQLRVEPGWAASIDRKILKKWQAVSSRLPSPDVDPYKINNADRFSLKIPKCAVEISEYFQLDTEEIGKDYIEAVTHKVFGDLIGEIINLEGLLPVDQERSYFISKNDTNSSLRKELEKIKELLDQVVSIDFGRIKNEALFDYLDAFIEVEIRADLAMLPKHIIESLDIYKEDSGFARILQMKDSLPRQVESGKHQAHILSGFWDILHQQSRLLAAQIEHLRIHGQDLKPAMARSANKIVSFVAQHFEVFEYAFEPFNSQDAWDSHRERMIRDEGLAADPEITLAAKKVAYVEKVVQALDIQLPKKISISKTLPKRFKPSMP